MADVVAVLVVPLAGDPRGLIAEGACGSCPPIVYCAAGGGWAVGRGWSPMYGGKQRPNALPLWWDGALVPEGWDRLRRVWLASTGHTPLAIGHRSIVTRDQAEMMALDVVRLGLATRVVRLARDADDRLVEVSP